MVRRRPPGNALALSAAPSRTMKQISPMLRDDRKLIAYATAMLRWSPKCQILGSGNSDSVCDLARRLAHEVKVSTVSPSSTGGSTTRLTADQP